MKIVMYLQSCGSDLVRKMIEFKANQYKRLAGCHSHKSHENSLSNLKIFFNEILRQKYEMARVC